MGEPSCRSRGCWSTTGTISSTLSRGCRSAKCGIVVRKLCRLGLTRLGGAGAAMAGAARLCGGQGGAAAMVGCNAAKQGQGVPPHTNPCFFLLVAPPMVAFVLRNDWCCAAALQAMRRRGHTSTTWGKEQGAPSHTNPCLSWLMALCLSSFAFPCLQLLVVLVLTDWCGVAAFQTMQRRGYARGLASIWPPMLLLLGFERRVQALVPSRRAGSCTQRLSKEVCWNGVVVGTIVKGGLLDGLVGGQVFARWTRLVQARFLTAWTQSPDCWVCTAFSQPIGTCLCKEKWRRGGGSCTQRLSKEVCLLDVVEGAALTIVKIGLLDCIVVEGAALIKCQKRSAGCGGVSCTHDCQERSAGWCSGGESCTHRLSKGACWMWWRELHKGCTMWWRHHIEVSTFVTAAFVAKAMEHCNGVGKYADILGFRSIVMWW